MRKIIESGGIDSQAEDWQTESMKKLIAVLLVLTLLGLPQAAWAVEATGSAPSRFGLLVEQWQDRLNLMATQDEAARAELELKIAEKYNRMLSQIETLPEDANKARIREILEQRKLYYKEIVEKRMTQKEELREKLQNRIEMMEQKGEEWTEKKQEQLRKQMEATKGAEVKLQLKNKVETQLQNKVKIEQKKLEMKEIKLKNSTGDKVRGAMTNWWDGAVAWIGL